MNAASRTPAPAVAIIGVGPRGLTVLERLVALATKRFAGHGESAGSRHGGSAGSRHGDYAGEGGSAGSAASGHGGSADARELALTIHLIDPYPPGAGIVWRTDQPESLLMNTTIAEQTVFPDASCTFLGPDEEPPGPSMAEWYRASGGTEPLHSTFPSRSLYGRYLRDAYRRIRSSAPDFIEIIEHPTKAESVIDLPAMDLPLPVSETSRAAVPEQLVRCQDGTTIVASAVVLAVGHIPSAQPEERARLAAFAERNGGLYLPQGLPAETPVAEVAPGEQVIVRGMGLNYFDLQTLFTYERGGRFVPEPGGRLRYVPCGEEPLLALGSRRGIPYRSKPICHEHPRRDWPLRYFTKDNIALLAGLDDLEGERRAGARFNDQLWPLVLADLRLAYYHTLSQVRPEAFAGDPGQLREAIGEAVSRHLTRRTWQETHPQAAGDGGAGASTASGSTRSSAAANAPESASSKEAGTARTAASATTGEEAARQGRVTREAFAWSEIEEALVPDAADRMSLHALLNPLEGELFTSREPGEPGSLHEWMLDFLRTDLRNSLAGPTGSPEKALFTVLWQSRLLLKELIVAGHIDRVSLDMEILGWFEGFVSGICDGPPPQRIAELLALAEAGIVSFIGPDMRIEENKNVLDADATTAGSDTALPQAHSARSSTITHPAHSAGSSTVARPAHSAGSSTVARPARTADPASPVQEPRPKIFTVTSAQAAGEITGSVVIDAASPTNSVARAADVLLYGMLERGQLTAARLTLDDGREKFLNGLALTPRPYRTIDVEGHVHPRRFALSIQLSSKQWGLAIAANPGTNAATLNDSHAAAKAILDLL